MKAFQDKNRFLRFLALFLLIPFYWAIYSGCMGGVNSGGGGGSGPGNLGTGQNPDPLGTAGGGGGGPGGGGPGGGGPGGGGPGGGGGGDEDQTDVAGGFSGQTSDDGIAAPKREYIMVHVLPPAGYAYHALKKTEGPGDATDTFADPTDIYPDTKPQAVLKMAGVYEGPYSSFGDPQPTDSSGYLLTAYPLNEKKGVCKSFIIPYATFEWKGTTYIAEGCPLTCPRGGSKEHYPVDIQLRSPETPKKPCLPMVNVDTSGMVNAQ